jgi:hypothetical protein
MNTPHEPFGPPPVLPISKSERLYVAGRAFRERGNQFFSEARFGVNYSGYFKIIRHALEVVEFTPLEDATYAKWLEMDNNAVYQAGLESPRITDQQMMTLAIQDDPAVFIIATAEHLRSQYPNMQRDASAVADVCTVYTVLAAGVHRDRVF